MLDGSINPIFRNGAQVEQLVREVRLVGQVVDDSLLEPEVHSLTAKAAERGPRKTCSVS
jgi:hypothetical protein